MQHILRKLTNLPWGFVALFDVAALLSLALAIALIFGLPSKNAHGILHSTVSTKRIALSFDDAPRGRVVSERDFPEALTLLGAPPQVPSAVLTPSVLAKLPW